MNKVFLIVALISLISGVVYASNPADLTSDHRSFVSEFYKVGYDGGPRFACINLPVGETLNALIFNWQNKKGDVRLCQLIVAKKFSSWLDGAVDTIFTGDSLSENLIADVHWNMLGLGLIMPLQSDEDVKVGPRVSIRGFTAYLTTAMAMSKDADKLYGASYSVKGIKAEVAYSDKTWFARFSRNFKTSFGILIPESRNKLTKDEKFFGLALGFIPN